MSRNRVIGRDGKLPWRLSADLKRFKALTMGHHLVMGRKTFDSLPGALPGRKLIVLSRQVQQSRANAMMAAGLQQAIQRADGDDESFVIGGGEIFAVAEPLAGRMYVTWVEADVAGDTFFPTIDWTRWREISAERHSADAKNEYDTTFCVYDRVPSEGP